MTATSGVIERVEPGPPRPRAARPASGRRFAGSLGELHRPDYSILVSVVALSLIGILMVYSSSAMRSYVLRDDALAIVAPQILWAAVGLVVMLVLMRIDYRLLRITSLPAYLVAAGLLVLVFVPGWNRVVGGSARWLVIGPLPAIHPAEIAKLVLVIVLAHWLARRGTKVKSFFGGLLPALAIALPIIALVFKEPDLGTTMVITATVFIMLFVAGARIWQFGGLALVGAAAAIVVGLERYQMNRIRAFLDPWADPSGAGFHTVQGLLALGSGGVFGEGLGQGRLAGGLYLPNAWNDFIFAVIGEEFGFFGAAIVIALFLILGYAGARTALNAPDTFGALLAVGITGWLAVQAVINIGVVVAILPVTGITLPFISAGGSSLIVSFAAVGILLSISRETIEGGNVEQDATPDRGGRNGRAHLPGSRRRRVASRAPGSA
ncbi:MAG TPA: putative lipid II flippase FtsW [Candidatus Polarisedimenticolia bacterium]|nr:putative lipid II flippase FtsW [Candidatus Polarisedimenticolia bacterium]